LEVLFSADARPRSWTTNWKDERNQQKKRNWKSLLLTMNAKTLRKSPRSCRRNLIRALLPHSQNLRPNSLERERQKRREAGEESSAAERQTSLENYLVATRDCCLQKRAASPNLSLEDCRH